MNGARFGLAEPAVESLYRERRRIHAAVRLDRLMAMLRWRLGVTHKPTWCVRAPGCPVHGVEAC